MPTSRRHLWGMGHCAHSPQIVSFFFNIILHYYSTTFLNSSGYNPQIWAVMLSFGGFQPSQASTSFHNSQQLPKSSTMLGLGGFRPLQASTSFHDPQQPLKSSTMLVFGGFRPHYCIIDCTYASAIYYFLCLLFCAIHDKSHLNNKNSVLFCTTLDQLHSTLYCPMPDL